MDVESSRTIRKYIIDNVARQNVLPDENRCETYSIVSHLLLNVDPTTLICLVKATAKHLTNNCEFGIDQIKFFNFPLFIHCCPKTL